MTDTEKIQQILKDALGCVDAVKLMRLGRNWKTVRETARPLFSQHRRMALLCGATTDIYAPLLEVGAAARGIFLDLFTPPFGTWQQQILDSSSGLHQFKPEITLLHLTHSNLTCWPRFGCDVTEADKAAEDEAAQILNWCRAIHTKHSIPVLLANFHLPPHDSLSNLSTRFPSSRSQHVQRVNLALSRGAPSFVTLVDIDGMASRFGIRRWMDSTAWYHSKQPLSYDAMPIFTGAVASILASVWLGSAKCIVLDLDNTLWGGVVADDGVEGIRLGQGSAEGEAFQDFQRYLLELRQRGILLAVCSKNNDASARAAFEQHDGMLIKLADVSAFAVNFQPKADNVRALAKQLNIGLDAMVFLDDNPVEREQMRQFAPQVRVIDLPEDPGSYIAAVADSFCFEALTITSEDLIRAKQYADNQKRSELSAQVTDIGEFLKSLEMRGVLASYNAQDMQRIVQLINKSNQFNLCTQRYTQEELEAIAADPACITLSVRLQDRFGDNGLISAIHGTIRDGTLHVETWVMSCRVLDRTVEQMVLNYLARQAVQQGGHAIEGRYLPTAKNALVSEHYSRLGFCSSKSASNGATSWRLDLAQFIPLVSPIQIIAHEHGNHSK